MKNTIKKPEKKILVEKDLIIAEVSEFNNYYHLEPHDVAVCKAVLSQDPDIPLYQSLNAEQWRGQRNWIKRLQAMM